MRKGSYSDTIEKYKLGRNTLMNLLDGTGAIKRFGKAVRIDIPTASKVLDTYID